MTTFTPANLTLVEFIGTTSQTVTINAPTAEPPALQDTFTITNVTYVADKIPGDLNITWSGSSFTFSSKFNDVFDRTLKYLIYKDRNSANKQYFSVKKFEQVPPDVYGLYQYIPPPSDYIFGDFVVSYSSLYSGNGSATWTLTLEHDWASSNKKLIATVNRGTEFVNAKKYYPELN